MTNEARCKVLCHNIVALIHEMVELGIKPDVFEEVLMRFQCCFCGKSIEQLGPDPVSLTVVLANDQSAASQELWSHAKCLKTHLKEGTPTLLDAQ